MALLFRACRSMSRPSSPTSEVIALRERRWQKPHATYATRVTLGTLDHSPRQIRRPCRPHCARGLGCSSARRAHARIGKSAGLNPLGCSCTKLLPRGNLRTALGPSALSSLCSSLSAGTIHRQSSRRGAERKEVLHCTSSYVKHSQQSCVARR
jgi:hypothetical protein